jgi:hypothetical protein
MRREGVDRERPYLKDRAHLLAIADKLTQSQRRGLLSKPGHGAFPVSVYNHLEKAGLMDYTYCPTDLGFAVCKALRGEPL